MMPDPGLGQGLERRGHLLGRCAEGTPLAGVEVGADEDGLARQLLLHDLVLRGVHLEGGRRRPACRAHLQLERLVEAAERGPVGKRAP